jgi:hypothetical protein
MLVSLLVPLLFCFLNLFLYVAHHLETFIMGRFIMLPSRLFRDAGGLA